VQIGDGSGNSFNIIIEYGYFASSGSWRTNGNTGYLMYTSGIAVEAAMRATSNVNIYLYGTGGVDAGYGIRLDSYESPFSGVNDAGTGDVAQAWVLQLSPGAISWALAD
jgi:hypothetical protein